MFGRLAHPAERGRATKTVEAFGWFVLLEGLALLFAPRMVAGLLHIEIAADQVTDYMRIMGLLAGGVGMLYVVSGRVNAIGFAFRVAARPPAGATDHGDPLVPGNRPRLAGARILGPGLRRIPLDAVGVASRRAAIGVGSAQRFARDSVR
jgi:hypothetical protein